MITNEQELTLEEARRIIAEQDAMTVQEAKKIVARDKKKESASQLVWGFFILMAIIIVFSKLDFGAGG